MHLITPATNWTNNLKQLSSRTSPDHLHVEERASPSKSIASQRLRLMREVFKSP